ncbi:MAG: hypothetical protein V1799_06010 [bacterium]
MNRISLLIILLWLVIPTACNIFETREPESPTQSSTQYLPPTEPGLVFTNMATSFKELNSLYYIKSFADSSLSGKSFRFDPDPQAKLKYGGVFLNWTKQSEQQYFDNMKSRIPSGASASLTFQTLTVQSLQSDSAQYEAGYFLNIQHTSTTIPKEIKGRAQFFLIADRSRNWTIWRWVDLPTTTGAFSWSDLKGEFGQ